MARDAALFRREPRRRDFGTAARACPPRQSRRRSYRPPRQASRSADRAGRCRGSRGPVGRLRPPSCRNPIRACGHRPSPSQGGLGRGVDGIHRFLKRGLKLGDLVCRASGLRVGLCHGARPVVVETCHCRSRQASNKSVSFFFVGTRRDGAENEKTLGDDAELNRT